MFQKMKDWFRQERMMQSVSNLQLFQEKNDPRELPRPERCLNNNFTSSSNITKDKENLNTDCYCKNCQEFSDNFSECVICMEPLQCAAISSCMFCGNYTCWNCSEKITNCPFCRVSFSANENRIRNFALERILLKLSLPCRYSRWGCRMQLTHTEREIHEISCLCAPAGCPLVKLCGWHGDSSDIVRHLKDTHDLTLIASNGIRIEIADFRKKLLSTLIIPRLYTVSLKCYGHIFICKLKLVNHKLRLIFFQIAGETSEKLEKYEVELEIFNSSRSLIGTIQISPKFKDNKEIVIPGHTIIDEKADLLTINITIKQKN